MGRFLTMIKKLFNKLKKKQNDYIIEDEFNPQTRLEEYKKLDKEYWKSKKLEDMSELEWELLCDGCGKCCLNKMDDIKGNVQFTDVACRMLNHNTCSCKIYENRFDVIKTCKQINMDCIKAKPRWLPKTCAYWLLDNGQDLPIWHPLITGDVNTVHEAGKSAKGRVVSENKVINYGKHIVDWDDV